MGGLTDVGRVSLGSKVAGEVDGAERAVAERVEQQQATVLERRPRQTRKQGRDHRLRRRTRGFRQSGLVGWGGGGTVRGRAMSCVDFEVDEGVVRARRARRGGTRLGFYCASRAHVVWNQGERVCTGWGRGEGDEEGNEGRGRSTFDANHLLSKFRPTKAFEGARPGLYERNPANRGRRCFRGISEGSDGA